MSQSTRTIALHQLLHGYDGGHKLLAGSRELPPTVARKILVQSDLSGSIPPKAFETYLTGYPLREIAAYAFARTWYAPEMPRPGCVWTHTLLIGAEDVKIIPSLSSFLKCFARPRPGEFDDFRASIKEQITDATFGKNIQPTDCENMLRSFYGAEQRPVVMAGNEQELFETLFTELWSQLWPQGRLDFTFSTGSLSARKFDARPFDLQLAPTNAAREVIRASGAILAQREDSPSSDELGRGISALVADFIGHGFLGLRKFLVDVADVDFVRRDAVRAALIYDALPGSGTLTENQSLELLQTVATHFPEAEKAETLKRYCLNVIERSGIPQANLWIIIQIATHDYGEAFASADLGLSDRMTRLGNSDSSTALDLLLKLSDHSLSRFGEQIAYSIISAQADSQVLAFLKRNPRYVSTFVKVRPVLASKTEFWTALDPYSHEILEAVAGAKLINSGELNLIFAALFNAQLDREANHFFSLFGPAAVAAVFADRGPYPKNLRNRWIDALAARPDLVESFLKRIDIITPEILVGVSETYTPARATEDEFPLDHWITALATWEPEFTPHLESTVETCAFSLALAFRLNGKKAAELGQLSFQNVYLAAAKQTISSSAWSMLEPLVPNISWIRDWDRCERMRRALITRFDGDQWPLEYVFRILNAREILSDFVHTALKLSDGRRLLDRIIAAIEAGTLQAENGLINMLADSLQRSVRAMSR